MQERNVCIFEGKSMDNIEEFLLASLASVSKEFQHSSFFFIHLNWEGVLI